MSRGRQYIQFEGYFAENLLGIFRVIRGFADLRDLAAVSVPYEMTEHDTQACRVVGHQRELNEKHAQDIKNYLEQSDNRFLPEVVLSCRVPVLPIDQDQRVVAETDEPPGFVIGVQDDERTPVSIRRRYSSKNTRIQTIRMARQDLDQIKEDKLIRRIDGNHRLALAEQLQDDPTVPTKFIAPFCLILLGDAGNEADDYAESLIFHTINNTALPLESEHGLRLLLGQDSAYDMTPENEFNYSPELYLTRLLSTQLRGLPQPARERFGDRPLTVLWEAARNLIAVDETIVESRGALEAFADDLFAGLSEILVRLTVNHPSLYDFGDSWEHELVLEESCYFNPDMRTELACLEGERACPPEDVGGIPGYLEFCNALNDPNHEEHESYMEWSGGDFDSERFDSESVNWELMKYLRWSRDRYQNWGGVS